jgi:membrane protein YqaA with SNARE-associated domain
MNVEENSSKEFLMEDVFAYGGLFLAAFLAATIFPAQSEFVLIGMLMNGNFSPSALFVVASIGNILGSCVNYMIGLGLAGTRTLDRFINAERRQQAERWYRKYGRWSLLLSWAPIIGDPLTIVAGLCRDRFLFFVGIVSIAKAGRYAVIMALHHAWSQ